jgi:hypothetical protein
VRNPGGRAAAARYAAAAMPASLWVLILILALASRPIEVRLWRAGRLSDRAVTVLLLARFPLLVAVGAFATSGPLVLDLLLVGLSLLPSLLLYRFVLGIVRERSADPH